MILNKKTRNDIYNEIVEQVRDGIVIKEREEILFSSNNDSYLLEGAGSGTISIISITNIEGIRNDGFYSHPTETFNGIDSWTENVDFVLSGSSGAVAPSYAGIIAGEPLYDYIVWQGTNKPQDNTYFYVSYKYFDNNKVINPNRPISFTPGSIGSAFANAFANIVGNMYNELNNTHIQSHLQTATGEDLELRGENYGLTRRQATSSTGYVQITNNTGNDYDITISHRFTTSGFNVVVFIPQESKTISNGNTDTIYVKSADTGFTQNVGINTIDQLFETSSLSTKVQNVVVNNPGTIAGNTNLFNDGANIENDNNFRNRVQNVINKRGVATKTAIASAIENLPSVRQAKVYDFEDKKSIPKPDIQIFVVGETDKIIKNPNTLSNIGLTVYEVKSAGIRPFITTPMGIYVDISGSVFIDKRFISQQTSIVNDVKTSITNYVNNLNVGEDVVYSRLIEEMMKIPNVKKAIVSQTKYSEYSFHPYNQSTKWQVYASGSDINGTFNRPYAQQFLKLPTGFHDVYTYDGTTTYTMSGSNISSGITPSVYIAIQNRAGTWIRDPQYLIDWYSSAGTNTITIDDTIGNSAGVFLVSGSTKLIFNYESYENHDIDGIRVMMSGSIGSGSNYVDMEISIWSGTNVPTNKITNLSGTVQVTAGAKEYDIKFNNTHTFDQTVQKHWVVISGTTIDSELSGSSVHTPLESSNRGAYGTPAVKWFSGSTSWVTNTASEKYMEVLSLTYDINKNDISISNISDKSEIAVLNNVTINGYAWKGDII